LVHQMVDRMDHQKVDQKVYQMDKKWADHSVDLMVAQTVVLMVVH